MIRSDMNKIISMLESSGFQKNRDVILSPEYADAVKTLIDTGCIKAVHSFGGEIVGMKLLDHASTYRLERQDVWLNRLFGFLAGVATTVAATVLLHFLPL